MQRCYSGIYWHFTGSPKEIDWGAIRRPADILRHGQPRTDDDAVDILLKILESQKLLATCSERITDTIKTDPFCCVTDIPLKDLPTHAPYYGRVAIGFSAQRIHQSFAPVLYLPEENFPIKQRLFEPDAWCAAESEQWYQQGDMAAAQYWDEMATHYGKETRVVDEPALNGYFKNFIKVTAFSLDAEHTFYREREWRHVGDFCFTPSEVEAVIAPRKQGARIREWINADNRYTNHGELSLVTWEFLENA